MIDISDCSANCTPQLIYTLNDDNGAGGVEANETDDRLDMSIHDRVPNIRTVSFLEKQGGTWAITPLLRHVISNDVDTAYATVRGLANVAVGKWNYNNGSVPSHVITSVVEHVSGGNTIDVIDVTHCIVSGVTSCLNSGESTVLRTGITGSSASVIFPTENAPDVLVNDGGWVKQLDLDSQTMTPLVQGYDVDSAD